ncbi:MAG: hypothetical protein WCY05_03290, partial [Candidatus Omnitrophota bacterium]
MIILTIEILLVFLSSYLLTARLFRIRNFVDFLLICFTLSFAQIILVELILSFLNKFTFQHVLLGHILIFLIVFLFLKGKPSVSLNKPNVSLVFRDKILLFSFLVFTSFFSVKAFVNLINPPFCVDSLQYYLTFPAFWFKS